MRQLLILFLALTTLFSCKQDAKAVQPTEIESSKETPTAPATPPATEPK